MELFEYTKFGTNCQYLQPASDTKRGCVEQMMHATGTMVLLVHIMYCEETSNLFLVEHT